MLISFTDKGLYCAAGDFYIDPWKPVDKAVITHGHSDHARYGNKHYLCHEHTKPVLQLRLGENSYQTLRFGETVFQQGVSISMFPAGHIVGSAQVRVEYKGEIWVISGDYKTEDDGISGAFEPVRCQHFVTESTFGLPIYLWKQQEQIYDSIRQWIIGNKASNRASVLIAYSLGKAQRVMQAVKDVAPEVYAHGAVHNMHENLCNSGVIDGSKFPVVHRVTNELPKERFKNAVIIAPPSADGSPWMKRFVPYSLGICSGWMQVRGNQRRKNADAGFALSDHCDWPSLLKSVEATGAEKVYVTHGFQAAFSRYLNESGIAAMEIKTEYGVDEEETGTPDVEETNELQ